MGQEEGGSEVPERKQCTLGTAACPHRPSLRARPTETNRGGCRRGHRRGRPRKGGACRGGRRAARGRGTWGGRHARGGRRRREAWGLGDGRRGPWKTRAGPGEGEAGAALGARPAKFSPPPGSELAVQRRLLPPTKAPAPPFDARPSAGLPAGGSLVAAGRTFITLGSLHFRDVPCGLTLILPPLIHAQGINEN